MSSNPQVREYPYMWCKEYEPANRSSKRREINGKRQNVRVENVCDVDLVAELFSRNHRE